MEREKLVEWITKAYMDYMDTDTLTEKSKANLDTMVEQILADDVAVDMITKDIESGGNELSLGSVLLAVDTE